MSDFANRLKKALKARQAWAKRERTTAYRLYDLDIPEWPFAVDWYAGHVHVAEYPSRKQRRDDGLAERRAAVSAACRDVLEVSEDRLHWKGHQPFAWGEAPSVEAGPEVKHLVEEHGLTFEVELAQRLDTGLFLDHRPTRARVRQESKGKSVLNLFAYTGAFTVHALAGGASETTTVDLSRTYCDWAERNLRHNGFSTGPKHRIICDDVLAWLEAQRGERYDLAIVDPPTFSTSKKMKRRFEVQRDHAWLLRAVRSLMRPGGVVYFSTNFLEFELDRSLEKQAGAIDSLPPDFRREVHKCWRLSG